jgi:hypothetical protein
MEDKRMSEQNPYAKLEVPEDASFEEIQIASLSATRVMKGRGKRLKSPTTRF